MDINFTLGVSSSATQIEKEDIDRMAEMGIRIYRLGMEWARIEPEQGKYDESAVDWYRHLLTYMKSKGIEPLLTIHHFTNPLWFDALGGFANPRNIPVFLGFVEYVVRHFSYLVDEYVTINEPNVFAVMRYFDGEFPPGIRSMKTALKVQSVLAACHVKAYELIHKLRREMGYINTMVGFAHHARVFEPQSKKNMWHRLCAFLAERMFQTALASACLTGRFCFPLRRYGGVKSGKYADFLGLNYYKRTAVSKLGDGAFENAPLNDLGWEIYPQGIVLCAQDLYRMLPRPIYITENGTCDNNDSFRCRFLYDHLKALAASDLPIERYYHWSLTDNFERSEGEHARFGLVYVDYHTQERTIKKSGHFYSAIIEHKGINDALFNEYVAEQNYHR